jgi:phytanoyl-CoA hydroxylase
MRNEQSQATRFDRLTSEQVAAFHREGWLVLPGWLVESVRRHMLLVTMRDLVAPVGPVEYEADVHYPGSPTSRDSEGGTTVRRLKEAHGRDPIFTHWVSQPHMVRPLQQLLQQRVVMPLAHHNCIMTKQPRFSSATLWHQDIRYWSFQRPELISAWLALGTETPENGGLMVIPGSHVAEFSRHQYDDALFFRDDLPENQPWIDRRVPVRLSPGDVLLFHCRTLHAADRNRTDQTKYAAVFTFRPLDNPPVPGGRSASKPELLLPEASDV